MRFSQMKTSIKRQSRKGAMMPVVAFMLPIIMIFVGYSINIAYMELTRTELRLTCDSAAKAALVNYGATQSKTTAISFGQTVSNNNKVVGQTPSIPSGNFQFGNSSKNSGGTYIFTVNGTPINSVQVTGSADHRRLPFWRDGLVERQLQSVPNSSYATRISHDIMLVLDRSASMAFDLSGNEFSYPADRTLFSPLQSYFTPPSPTLSRWAALTSAVEHIRSSQCCRLATWMCESAWSPTPKPIRSVITATRKPRWM